MDTVFWVLVIAFALFQVVVMVVVLRASLAALAFFDAENMRRAAEERAELQQRFGAR